MNARSKKPGLNKYKSISESAFQKKVKDFLKKDCNAYVFKVIRSSRAGTPDLVACLPGGLFIGVEVKKETGKMSELQKVHRDEIKEKKGLHFTVKPSTFDDFKLELKIHIS